MKSYVRGWLAMVFAFVTLATCAACAQKSHGFQDAPVNQTNTDNTPAQIINFPDLYFNVATKCDHHGHRLYSNTRDSDVVVVTDKNCPSDWPN